MGVSRAQLPSPSGAVPVAHSDLPLWTQCRGMEKPWAETQATSAQWSHSQGCGPVGWGPGWEGWAGDSPRSGPQCRRLPVFPSG